MSLLVESRPLAIQTSRSAPKLARTAPSPWRKCHPFRRSTRPLRCSTKLPVEDTSPGDSESSLPEEGKRQFEDPEVLEANYELGMPYTFLRVLAAFGALETSYLTVVKYMNAEVACPTTGCESVLSSGYAYLFGLPLPLFGLLTYAVVGAVASAGAKLRSDKLEVPPFINVVLLAGVTTLASSSAYLMYILQTQLNGDVCVWCYLSALLSFILFAVVMWRMDRREMKQGMVPALGQLVITLTALMLGHADVSSAQDFELPYINPEVTTRSSSEAVLLAKRLKEAGAKMYGAFWCTHCYEQKQTFGREAMQEFPYVECYPSGWKRGTKLDTACEAVNIRAFPTWIIGGQTLEGELDLQQLEAELDKVQSTQTAGNGYIQGESTVDAPEVMASS